MDDSFPTAADYAQAAASRAGDDVAALMARVERCEQLLALAAPSIKVKYDMECRRTRRRQLGGGWSETMTCRLPVNHNGPCGWVLLGWEP